MESVFIAWSVTKGRCEGHRKCLRAAHYVGFISTLWTFRKGDLQIVSLVTLALLLRAVSFQYPPHSFRHAGSCAAAIVATCWPRDAFSSVTVNFSLLNHPGSAYYALPALILHYNVEIG